MPGLFDPSKDDQVTPIAAAAPRLMIGLEFLTYPLYIEDYQKNVVNPTIQLLYHFDSFWDGSYYPILVICLMVCFCNPRLIDDSCHLSLYPNYQNILFDRVYELYNIIFNNYTKKSFS